MKIVHVSDIHIRNLKYHSEYRRVFEDLYRHLDTIRPDLIVNTGDVGHTKTQISPEFVQMTSEHIRRTVSYAPYHVILGNHDLNLMNLDRQDAVSPIVESLQAGGTSGIYLHKKSGRVEAIPGVNFWVFSLADRENYPRPLQWSQFSEDINIGLFHGSIVSCVTDTDWCMTQADHELDIFDGLDYVFLGDIHKQQFFREGRIGYAGSLIQQNFGEAIDKGFLLWDIEDKENFDVSFVPLQGSRKFYTVSLTDEMTFDDTTLEPGSRIRIIPPRDLTLAEQKAAERLARQLFQTNDVMTLSTANVGVQKTRVDRSSTSTENLRQLAVQERMLRNYLKDREVSEDVVQRVLDLNRKYQIHLDQSEDVARDVSWKIKKIGWSNLFNYGEDNYVDFSSLGGLTGIFTANASGKSNFVDVILETIFDNTTRGINKNIFLVNDNKDSATMVAEISANGREYVIERTIERVKYGQKKFKEAREWGKTVCDFYAVEDSGEKRSLVGTLRSETERNIRQQFGTFEDMMLTALSAQWNPIDVISCKETDRKKILYRFLDLDIFDEKYKLAREESKQFRKRLAEIEDSDVEVKYLDLLEKIRDHQLVIAGDNLGVIVGSIRDRQLEHEIAELVAKKVRVDCDLDENSVLGEMRDIDARLESLVEEERQLKESLSALDEKIDSISFSEDTFDPGEYEKNETRLASLTEEILFKSRLVKEKKPDLKSYRKSLRLLEEVPCGDQFPQCQFLIDAFLSREKIPVLESTVQSIENDLVSLEKERDLLLEVKRKMDSKKSLVDVRSSVLSQSKNTKLQVDNVRLRIESCLEHRTRSSDRLEKIQRSRDNVVTNEEIDRKIRLFREERALLLKKVRGTQESVNRRTKQLGFDEGVLGKIKLQLEDIQELRQMCDAFEYYSQAMGKDGLAYQIMAQKLPVINEEINKILSSVADFGVFIEHDNEEQSIRIYIQYGQYKIRLLELGSGAEKMLASIAIRSALLNISSLPKSNMFIVDEGFGKLDPKNMEHVQKIFDYLKSVFEHVIVISHIDSMKDLVDNIIEISTDECGYARIEVGA